MLIESRIKPVPPKAVRNITLFGTPYEFKPILPGRYVANVVQDLHIKTFLNNPAYSEFKDELPGATLQRGAPAPVIAAAGAALTKDELPEGGEAEAEAEESEEATEDDGEDLAGGGASDEPSQWSTAIADEAAALLRNPPAKLPVAIGKVTHIDVLRCALALESNRAGRQKVRADVIELIEGTLRDIAAAS